MAAWSIADVARVCRYAGALRILDRASMETWAVAALDEPGAPPVLAEIATSGRLDDSALAALLEEVPGRPDEPRAARGLLGAIASAFLRGRIGIRRAEQGVFAREDVERDVRAFFTKWVSEAADLPVALSFETSAEGGT